MRRALEEDEEILMFFAREDGARHALWPDIGRRCGEEMFNRACPARVNKANLATPVARFALLLIALTDLT